jgi:hypothetical protein
MCGKGRDVFPRRAPGGRFDKVALEVEVGTLADDLGQHRQGFGEGARLGLQITMELRASGTLVGWASAEQDGLPSVFRILLCRLDVLKPRHWGLHCRCEFLRGYVASLERPLECFECRLSLDTCQLDPLFFEALLEVLLRAQREREATFSFAALLIELAQRSVNFLRVLRRAFELLLERLELLFGLVRSDRPIVPQLHETCQRAGGSTERRRSRTYRAVGCTTALVLKTSWATGPMPLRGKASSRRVGSSALDSLAKCTG